MHETQFTHGMFKLSKIKRMPIPKRKASPKNQMLDTFLIGAHTSKKESET